MTGPIIHERIEAIWPTGDENFDLRAYTERWIVEEILREAPCLEGREERVTVTSSPDPVFCGTLLYRAKALCPTPDTCSLLRKADW